MRALGDNVALGTNRLVIEAGIAANQALVLGTPVDTGRARGNWQASVGEGISGELDTEDPSGTSTIERNNAAISKRALGQNIFISNNVGYIGALNEGHSPQADPGFIEVAVLEAINRVKVRKVLPR